MRKVRIEEFSLSTAIDYRRPVTLSDAKLDEVIKHLTASACGDHLNPLDVFLDKQNEIFAYKLTIPLFNGAANITVNSLGITVNFKHGRTKDHLTLMLKLTLTAFEIAKVQDVKSSLISFNAHGVFVPASGYAEHMLRFTKMSEDVVSGGLVLVTRLPELGGELRYASEKSLAYPDALFFASNAVLQAEFKADVFDKLAANFEAAAALEEIEFLKN